MTRNEELFYLSQGDRITFTVYIPDDIYYSIWGIGIRVDLHNGDEVVLTVASEDGVEELLIGSELPNERFGLDGYYNLSDIVKEFCGKNVEISISANHIDDADSIVAVYTSSDYVHGLSVMELNGQKIGLYADIEFNGWSLSNECVIYSLVWIILIVFLNICLAWMLTFGEKLKRYELICQLLCTSTIIAVLSLLYPSLTWYGIDWCEGITFYQNLRERSFLGYFAQLEGGMYLSEFNNSLLWIANKLLRGGKHTFQLVQILVTLFCAFTSSIFCSKSYNKYFSMDFRSIISITIGCFIFTMEEYTLIAAAYFGIVFVLYALTYDYERIRGWFFLTSVIWLIVLCMSKMAYVILFPVATFMYVLLERREKTKKISPKKVILLTIMIGTSLEALLSVIIKRGLAFGTKLGTIQHLSIGNLLNGTIYFSIQMFISALMQEMTFSNGIALNVLFLLVVMSIIGWAVFQIVYKTEFSNKAIFLLSMYMLNCGNCALQLLTNHAAMIPGNINWNRVCYIPVNDKWWWYSFSYMSVFAFAIVLLSIIKQYITIYVNMSKIPHEDIKMISFATLIAICVIYVNQYAYRGDVNLTYVEKNQFTLPSMMIGNFKEYYYMQADDHFLIMASSMPGHRDWYYAHNVNYVKYELESKTSNLNMDDIGIQDTVCALYVHKDMYSNQLISEKYIAKIYSKNGDLISEVTQLDTDETRENICFYLEEGFSPIGNIVFEYEDGQAAYVDSIVRAGEY